MSYLSKRDKVLIYFCLSVSLLCALVVISGGIRGVWGIKPEPIFYEVEPTAYSPAVSGAWTNWNISATHGVPKGAVIEMVILSDYIGASYWLNGIRDEGSSLTRLYPMHEAESGGNTSIVLYNEVSSTGLIEYYQGSASVCDFYLTGYWVNVGFTEKDVEVTSGSNSGWRILNLGYGAERVHMFYLQSSHPSTVYSLGVRKVGTTLGRGRTIHEAEPLGGSSIGTIPCYVDYRTYVETYSNVLSSYADIYDIGYFDADLNFTQGWSGLPVGTSGAWDTINLSSLLKTNGDVASIILTHSATTAEQYLGSREWGTSIDRTLEEHESETSAYTGFSLLTNTDDANGYVELYAQDSSIEVFTYTGSFWWVPQPELEAPHELYGAGFNDTVTPYVNLRWDVLAGVDNDQFELQNSSDGITYSILTYPTNTTKEYNHTTLSNGEYQWYRIRTTFSYLGDWHNSSWSLVNLERVLYSQSAGGGVSITLVNGSWIDYNVSKVNIVRGTYVSGDLASLEYDDADYYLVDEVVGVEGFDIRFNFTGVLNTSISLSHRILCEYEGNPAHDVDIEIWNFTGSNWVDSLHIPEHGFIWNNNSMSLRSIDFNNNGDVWIRVVHHTGGVGTHYMNFDYVKLRAFIPVYVPSIGGGGGLIWWIGAIFIFVPVFLILSYVLRRK